MNRTFARILMVLTISLLLSPLARSAAGDKPTETPAQYAGWKHSGSFYITTTPEGANLPATASEDGFPLLVRLDKDWFDFSQAKAGGEDIRFAGGTGTPLAYEVDDWDAAAGTACIWVRIPKIEGNSRQQIKMFWGNPDAASESNGKAVFNESNGYLSVLHMSDPAKDAAGLLEPKDRGTTASAGVIGRSRFLPHGKGIECGTDITGFPTGSSPHSTELWCRIGDSLDRLVAWGNNEPRDVVQITLSKPPRIMVDCFNGSANVNTSTLLPRSRWVHVFHTYKNGESKVYVDGQLAGFSQGHDNPLALTSPAKMYIGGWGGHYGFSGDIDEVRVSNVTRSENWVRMQYENQKPLQTLLGPLVQPGDEFSVSDKKITLLEGKSTVLTAKAGGAQRVAWIVKRGDIETVAEVNRFHFTVDAGRVVGDQSLTLRFRAVYPNEVKTLDIPVTILEDIPEPAFTLKGPDRWDGRQAVEIVPEISNQQAMQAKGAGDLKYDWSVSDIAVVKEIMPGKLILKRAQNSGTMTVTVTVSNGGKPTTQAIKIVVKEPAKDAWVQRTPEKDEKPVDNQFYARDDSNEGTLYYNGTLDAPADSVFLKLYADGELVKTETQKPTADNSYVLAVRLKAGLIKYKVEFGSKAAGVETLLRSVDNLVCGDAYVIQGQSNAVAYNYHNSKDPFVNYSSTWIRSFGGNGEADDPLKGGWGDGLIQRLKPADLDRVHFIGVWGMALAQKLVADQKIPICILNGAVGGTRIDQHMPDPVDTSNRPIYRDLMKRLVAARLTHGIRAVLWHQGEADQGYDGPDNCLDADKYQQYFVDLSAAWKQDMPNIEHYYVFQIYPETCGAGLGSDPLRDIQRRLSRLYSNLSVMSTLQFPSGAGCHFQIPDYVLMGNAMASLAERDINGRQFEKSVAAPDLQRAYFTSDKKDEIAMEFDQPMAWADSLASQFVLDGAPAGIVEGSAAGNVIKIKLASASAAKRITYLVGKKWDRKSILYGQNGIAALTFCDVEIDASPLR